jgi:hypothetical protein
MLEIFIVFRLCRTLGNKLREKERNPLGYQFLLVALWIVGEIMGGVVGFVVGAIANNGDEPSLLFGYGGALLGAACGAGLVFFIAHQLPSLAIEPMRIDPDDAYGPGWRRSDRELLDRFDQEGNGSSRTNSKKKRRPNMDLDEGYDEKFMRPRREQIEPDEHRPDDGIKDYRDRLID